MITGACWTQGLRRPGCAIVAPVLAAILLACFVLCVDAVVFEPLRTPIVAIMPATLCGLAGVVLVAVTAGQALKLVVEVQGEAGTVDVNGSRYLVARLAALGSEGPRGLKVPQNTDASKLPADALTSLPESAVAKAVVSAILAARTGIPWRATVTVHDAGTVTLALYRNDQAVGETRTLTRESFGLPLATGDEGKAAGRRQLLTVAAAYILVELSRAHPGLRTGLGGAAQARSIALVALAQPVAGLPKAVREKLITAAVADERGNLLARVADLARLGTDATRKPQ